LAQAGAISPRAVPERYRFVDEIEKTGAGRLDKKRLRERYAEVDVVGLEQQERST
jgi:fatty-acyl-CoA synthase